MMTVNGRDVEICVYFYYSDMVEVADESKFSEVMKESFVKRDVVIYSGHVGSGVGFILDYQPKHEIKAVDFANLEMVDKYQIFVFDGCRTYRTYVDDMLKNSVKIFDNVDMVIIVNTTFFSVGYYLIWEFLYWFTITNDAGAHFFFELEEYPAWGQSPVFQERSLRRIWDRQQPQIEFSWR